MSLPVGLVSLWFSPGTENKGAATYPVLSCGCMWSVVAQGTPPEWAEVMEAQLVCTGASEHY